LIDTGADATSVDPEILTRLGATAVGQVEMVTASGVVMVNRYEVSLSIFGLQGVTGPALTRPTWNVTDFSRPLPGIQALLGMDLVRQIVLKIDGPRKTFTLVFE